jgi:hypothetical protein
MNTFVQVLVKHGYSVLFVSVFACQMGLPVPAILFLMAAGVLAGSGQLSLGVGLCLAVIACLLADLLWYEAGRRWGDQILHFIYGLAVRPSRRRSPSGKTTTGSIKNDMPQGNGNLSVGGTFSSCCRNSPLARYAVNGQHAFRARTPW